MGAEDSPARSSEAIEDPVVAVAVHAGHQLRDEVAERIALDEAERLLEEDPGTADWTALAGTRMVASRSRFEVDLNRPRHAAVYLRPEDAWGLRVWQSPPPPDLVARSLAGYDAFYHRLEELLTRAEQSFGRFVLYDLHSYNHRRSGPDAPAADPADNPDVNVGTGSMDRRRWAPVVERLLKDLGRFPFPGGALDARENVRFRGGHLCRWVHQRYPETGCCIAVDVKKFFMDEHSGAVDPTLHRAVGYALAATVPGVVEELARV